MKVGPRGLASGKTAKSWVVQNKVFLYLYHTPGVEKTQKKIASLTLSFDQVHNNQYNLKA